MSVTIELTANMDDIAVAFNGKVIGTVQHISMSATLGDNPAHATVVLEGYADDKLAADIADDIPWLSVIVIPPSTVSEGATDGKA